MKLQDPLMIALIKLYAKHQRFFYINYFANFKLIVSWLTEEELSKETIRSEIQVPWYARSYEIQELAIILKCSQGELYQLCLEIDNEHGFS